MMRCVRSLSVVCALALYACTPSPVVPKSPSIETLRKAAANDPKDANAASAVAMAELFGRGGDAARAKAAIARALALDPKSARLSFAAALEQDVHGHPSAALEAYFRAIDVAASSSDPEAVHVLEASIYAVIGSDGDVIGYTDKVIARLLPMLERPSLPAPVRVALSDALFPLLQRKGDPAGAKRVAAAVGCLSEMNVVGPFGPRELLGFDEKPLRVDPAKAFSARYDLGPGRGVRDTRTAHGRGCRLHLGAGPVAEAGTSFAQANVSIAKAGDYVLRIDTPNSIEIFVDGASVSRIDRRASLGARSVYSKLPLQPGSHLITIMVATRHPNPVLELSLLPMIAADDPASALPFTKAATEGFELYLRAAIALVRGDVLAARKAHARLPMSKDISALLALQRAGIALADPLVPEDVKHDQARRFLLQAAVRDAALWAPVMQLASLAAKSGRVKEATAALRTASERFPEVPSMGFALIEVLRSKGYNEQADREVQRLRELVPDACAPINAELETLLSRRRMVEAQLAAERAVRCDAQSNELYTLYTGRRDFTAARKELTRLEALAPEDARYSWLLAELSLAKNLGDQAGERKAIDELRARYPRSYAGIIEELDALFSQDKSQEARAALDAALVSEPTSMASLYRLAPILGTPHVLAPYRKDGKQAIEAFKAAGRTYDGPQVLVLDYMAVRVFSDGSSLSLVHTVQKAQSDEAVNQLAEVDVPEGAQVLALRAWKSDGRKLEADGISGKESVSLPSVAPGDFVELEYLQASAPADGFPNGYLGERFFFKSFEIPFHYSEMIVLLPKDMPYSVDARGTAPKTEEKVEGDLRTLRFKIEESMPLVAEPSSVSAREFIPSVRVGVRATWESMVESLRDVLVDRDLFDPYYAILAAQIVGNAAPKDHRLRAERLYAWVLENVENNNDVFSQSALMLRAKSGNRARVLHYMLGLAGVPSQLALARNFAGDAVRSDMADADTYDHLLVRVDMQEPIWLFTVERWAPFGFVPSALRGQDALLLAHKAPRVKVSRGLLGEDFRKVDVEVALAADGSAHIAVVETLHGGDAIAWRSQLEQIPSAELQRRFEQDYVSRLFPGASLKSLEVTGREQDRPDLTLSYALDVATYGRHVTGGLALPALLTTELSATFARTSTRKTTELLASSVRNLMRARVKLPQGARIATLPPSAALSAALPVRPSFEQKSALDKGVLVLDRSLSLPPMRIEPKDYPAFTEFCRRVDETEARELFVVLR